MLQKLSLGKSYGLCFIAMSYQTPHPGSIIFLLGCLALLQRIFKDISQHVSAKKSWGHFYYC